MGDQQKLKLKLLSPTYLPTVRKGIRAIVCVEFPKFLNGVPCVISTEKGGFEDGEIFLRLRVRDYNSGATIPLENVFNFKFGKRALVTALVNPNSIEPMAPTQFLMQLKLEIISRPRKSFYVLSIDPFIGLQWEDYLVRYHNGGKPPKRQKVMQTQVDIADLLEVDPMIPSTTGDSLMVTRPMQPTPPPTILESSEETSMHTEETDWAKYFDTGNLSDMVPSTIPIHTPPSSEPDLPCNPSFIPSTISIENLEVPDNTHDETSHCRKKRKLVFESTKSSSIDQEKSLSKSLGSIPNETPMEEPQITFLPLRQNLPRIRPTVELQPNITAISYDIIMLSTTGKDDIHRVTKLEALMGTTKELHGILDCYLGFANFYFQKGYEYRAVVHLEDAWKLVRLVLNKTKGKVDMMLRVFLLLKEAHIIQLRALCLLKMEQTLPEIMENDCHEHDFELAWERYSDIAGVLAIVDTNFKIGGRLGLIHFSLLELKASFLANRSLYYSLIRKRSDARKYINMVKETLDQYGKCWNSNDSSGVKHDIRDVLGEYKGVANVTVESFEFVPSRDVFTNNFPEYWADEDEKGMEESFTWSHKIDTALFDRDSKYCGIMNIVRIIYHILRRGEDKEVQKLLKELSHFPFSTFGTCDEKERKDVEQLLKILNDVVQEKEVDKRKKSLERKKLTVIRTFPRRIRCSSHQFALIHTVFFEKCYQIAETGAM